MRKILITLFILFSPESHAGIDSLNDGIYYAYWVYGEINDYKTTSLIASNPTKENNNFYFSNKKNDESNNEIYVLSRAEVILIFYKHDEIEGGPSIGWADAKFNNGRLIVGSPTVKNFYDETAGDINNNVKYKIGEKFTGNNKVQNEKEIIPLQKINHNEFKIDCLDYFNDNYKQNSKHPLKDDPMKNYSKKVLVNNNGLCNLILSQKKNEETHNGWILLKKIG